MTVTRSSGCTLRHTRMALRAPGVSSGSKRLVTRRESSPTGRPRSTGAARLISALFTTRARRRDLQGAAKRFKRLVRSGRSWPGWARPGHPDVRSRSGDAGRNSRHDWSAVKLTAGATSGSDRRQTATISTNSDRPTKSAGAARIQRQIRRQRGCGNQQVRRPASAGLSTEPRRLRHTRVRTPGPRSRPRAADRRWPRCVAVDPDDAPVLPHRSWRADPPRVRPE